MTLVGKELQVNERFHEKAVIVIWAATQQNLSSRFAKG